MTISSGGEDAQQAGPGDGSEGRQRSPAIGSGPFLFYSKEADKGLRERRWRLFAAEGKPGAGDGGEGTLAVAGDRSGSIYFLQPRRI